MSHDTESGVKLEIKPFQKWHEYGEFWFEH